MSLLTKVFLPAVVCSMALVGCQKTVEKVETPAPATPVAAPSDTASASAPAVVDSSASASIVNTTYSCDQGKTVTAEYDNTQAAQSKVALTIDGKTYQLNQAVAASGARYTTEQGLTANQGLSWHTKGPVAIASTITLDHTAKPEDEKVLLNCTEKTTS